MWVSKVLQYQPVQNERSIKNPQQIEDIIKLGIYSFEKEIELQTGIPLEHDTKRAIEKKYIRMILFDYLVGRKYRTLDYYLISKINDQGKPVWHDAYLSPISVSNSVEKDNIIKDNEYQINNKLIDRDILFQVLFSKYYSEIKKVTEAINDAKKLYEDAISRIIYNNTNLEYAPNLENMILANLENIAKKEKEIEDQLNKERKMNKVERTMATQSLNVRVTAKLDLIQKKYPINPKDHPELKDKKRTEEEIKLIVEKENTSGGFATTSILTAAISLVCGIGIGIAYILLTFGN